MRPLPKASDIEWSMGDVRPPAKVQIYGWYPDSGKQQFLERFYELTAGRRAI